MVRERAIPPYAHALVFVPQDQINI